MGGPSYRGGKCFPAGLSTSPRPLTVSTPLYVIMSAYFTPHCESLESDDVMCREVEVDDGLFLLVGVAAVNGVAVDDYHCVLTI